MRFLALFLVLTGLFLTSCATVPITGRSQLNIMPNATMLAMSFTEYDKFLQEHKLSNNVAQSRMVKKVGHNIEMAVEKYFKSHGLNAELKNYAWEFNLVENKAINAWCMPGGKVVVYTGIMDIAQDANGLAVVMGHEIAHAIAKHGSERMSQTLMLQLGGAALDAASQSQSPQNRALMLGAYGIGTQVGIMLPFSRSHESEADFLGLVFMTMAGYDPHEAVNFWQRMAAKNAGQKPPEFLSTHPADATRIRRIKAAIPQIIGEYGRK